MLDATSVVQANQGSTGAASSTGFNMTLGSPTTAGNSLMALLIGSVSPNAPAGFTQCIQTSIGSGVNAQGHGYGRDTPGGESSFAVTMTSGAAVWYIAELTGVASMQVQDPVFFTVLALDLQVAKANGSLGGASVGSGFHPNAPSQSGDLVVFAFSYAAVSSGTPPLLTGTPTHPADAGVSWARTGATVATSRASGVNLRLDVFFDFGAGVLQKYDATFTWASAPAEIWAEVDGWKAFNVVPQQTSGRAATNSMM